MLNPKRDYAIWGIATKWCVILKAENARCKSLPLPPIYGRCGVLVKTLIRRMCNRQPLLEFKPNISSLGQSGMGKHKAGSIPASSLLLRSR